MSIKEYSFSPSELDPFLNLILKLYFLPYNTVKYFIYICDRHRFEMLETEIRVLKGKKDDEE